MWTKSRFERLALSDRTERARPLALLLFCALVLTWPKSALAQGASPIELKWDAPAECPSVASVAARVRRIAGTAHASGTGLQAEGTVIQSSEGGYHLRLLIRAGNLLGVRNIDGKSCKDLAGAAAVALALLLSSGEPLDERKLSGTPSTSPGPSDADPASGTQNQGEQSRPAASSAPPASASPRAPVSVSTPASAAAPTESAEAPPARSRHWLLVLPLGALGFGPLQKPSIGLGLAGGVSFGDWRFLTEGKLWRTQHATITSLLDEYGADLSRLSVTVRGCRAIWGQRLELAPCATVSLQHVSARGEGPLIASRNAGATFIAAGVGAQARLLIAPWLGLIAGVDAELETSRPVVQLGGIGTVERLAPAAATITIGSEWIL